MKNYTFTFAFQKSLTLLLTLSLFSGNAWAQKGKATDPKPPTTQAPVQSVEEVQGTSSQGGGPANGNPPTSQSIAQPVDTQAVTGQPIQKPISTPTATTPVTDQKPVTNGPLPVNQTPGNPAGASSLSAGKNGGVQPITQTPQTTSTIPSLKNGGVQAVTQTPQTTSTVPSLKNGGVQPVTQTPQTTTQIPVLNTPSVQAPVPAVAPPAPAPVVSGVQTAKADVPAAATKKSDKINCDDEAQKWLNNFLVKDTRTLGIMFELTAMRIARRALHQYPGITNLETLANKDIKALEVLQKSADPKNEAQDAVRQAYNLYGKRADLNTIADAIARDKKGAEERAQNGCYYDKKGIHRFKNDDASAYILAVVMGENNAKGNSGLTDIDAATVWAVERARAQGGDSYKIGTAHGNLLNVSTRVARYLSRIVEARDLDEGQLDKTIDAQVALLNGVLTDAYVKEIAPKYITCQKEQNNNCPDCAEKEYRAKNLDMDKIQRGLLKAIAESDNVKMEGDLRASMKDTTYDFSNFAKEGQDPGDKDILPAGAPRDRTDACMVNSWRKGAKRAPAQNPSNDNTSGDGAGATTAPVGTAPASPVPVGKKKKPAAGTPLNPPAQKSAVSQTAALPEYAQNLKKIVLYAYKNQQNEGPFGPNCTLKVVSSGKGPDDPEATITFNITRTTGQKLDPVVANSNKDPMDFYKDLQKPYEACNPGATTQ